MDIFQIACPKKYGPRHLRVHKNIQHLLKIHLYIDKAGQVLYRHMRKIYPKLIFGGEINKKIQFENVKITMIIQKTVDFTPAETLGHSLFK